jgi:two-component system nitrogen regulation response regulator GlnG
VSTPVEKDETPTLLPSDDPTFADGEERSLVPALTIVWHPDVTRIGETSTFPNLAGGGAVRITRKEPLFRPPGAPGPLRPLDDPSVSGRTEAVELAWTPAGTFQLRRSSLQGIAPGKKYRVEINGQPLVDCKDLSAEDLDNGQVIVVANVALYLHRTEHPIPIEAADELGIIGIGAETRRLRAAARRAAAAEYPVLIRGESGAGKTFLARAIHRASPRAKSRLIDVNISLLRGDLVASTLFGHERGAFTGAATNSAGYFGEASGGALFLDEIGHATLDVQRALLKAIEDREVFPVGATRPMKVDVRILAGTNAPLEEGIFQGSFLEELFHRLNVDSISVPALRERREDIGVLLLHYLRRELSARGHEDLLSVAYASRHEQPWLGASGVAAIIVKAATFRGNVRVLENAVKQLAASAVPSKRAAIEPLLASLERGEHAARQSSYRRDLPLTVESRPARASAKKPSPEEFHRVYLDEGRNAEKAAKRLGIATSTAYRMRDNDPGITQPRDLDDNQVLEAVRASGGDLSGAAERLGVAFHFVRQRYAAALRAKLGDEQIASTLQLVGGDVEAAAARLGVPVDQLKKLLAAKRGPRG